VNLDCEEKEELGEVRNFIHTPKWHTLHLVTSL
jgi:hypothetical protein